MSARPFVPRLSDEDLDLLLSRSLDGDLSPEEEHDLETFLAHDPAAARRKEELQRLVAEARALPAPAPPFALATRVNSNVSEKAGRGGSVFHRFGFYPPPGTAVGAMALLGIVVVAITVLKPAPTRIAGRVEGPVDVFLTEGGSGGKLPQPETPKIASKESMQSRSAAAPAAPAPAERAPAAVVASAPEKKNKLEGKLDDRPVDAEKADSFKKLSEQAPASVIASNETAFEEKQDEHDKLRQKLSKTESGAATAQVRRQSAPALDAAGGQAAGAPAPAAKAAGALAIAEPARAWSVAVRGEGARRWMLRRAPEGRPSVASPQASAFRIALDAEGRVTSVRALDARPIQPALLEFVRGLVFAPVVAVTDSTLRDRDEKAKDDRADAIGNRPAAPSSEIEVEISTR